MLYFFICVILLFLLLHINKNNKLLVFILIFLVATINFILDIPKESKEYWMYDFIAISVIMMVYVFMLIGTNFIMKVAFNKLSSKEKIKKVYLAFNVFSGIFISYLFFVKGVIYD